MYNTYWNLREQPFQNVTDPRFAYLSDQHHEVLARFIYLITGQKLGGVLTGPYGVGKSMVLELLAQKIRSNGLSRYLCVGILPGESLGLARQLLSFIGQPQPISDMTTMIEIVRSICHDPKAAFQHTVLAIDDAHLIKDHAIYDFLHMLTNISVLGRDLTPHYSAFTLILSGHMGLTANLAPFESLCQRFQLIWNLEPLTENQTSEYIRHRIQKAGGDIRIIEEAALQAIYQASYGLPRMINNLCDVALMLGCAARVSKVGKDLIQQAAHEGVAPVVKPAPQQGI
ncbi:MAG: AAA family ATPase [Kiritimatiellae bacterium]|nr:AAA family ATPase [Kiritimatiellia bacterium]